MPSILGDDPEHLDPPERSQRVEPVPALHLDGMQGLEHVREHM